MQLRRSLRNSLRARFLCELCALISASSAVNLSPFRTAVEPH